MKLKGFLIFLLAIIVNYHAFAQVAPLGKDLVKSFTEKIQAHKTINADFDFTIENIREGYSETYKGDFIFMGSKYRLNLMEMEVYYDGEIKWQFIPEANEVTISRPTELDGGFFEDPTQIFRDYEKDFKSRFIGEKIENGIGIYEVDLYPEDLSMPYSIIKIFFKKQNLEPVLIKYQGKDGTNFIIDVTKFRTNVTVKESDFTFDPLKHRGIEIVDLR